MLTWKKYDIVAWAIMLVPAKPRRRVLAQAGAGARGEPRGCLLSVKSEQRRLVSKSYYLTTAKLNSPKRLRHLEGLLPTRLEPRKPGFAEAFLSEVTRNICFYVFFYFLFLFSDSTSPVQSTTLSTDTSILPVPPFAITFVSPPTGVAGLGDSSESYGGFTFSFPVPIH